MHFKFFFTAIFFILLFVNKITAQVTDAAVAFNFAGGIVADSKGNLFVIDKNNRIIKITPDGETHNFAGSACGRSGTKNGAGTDALFAKTSGITIDKNDNLLIADYTTIRKVTPQGIVTTLYGNVNKSLTKEQSWNTDGFYKLGLIAVDNSGTVYVTDEIFDAQENKTFHIIRKVSTSGNVHSIKNSDGSLFMCHSIEGLACDEAGNLYVSAFAWNSAVKRISPDEKITNVAGLYDDNAKNRAYFKDGDAQAARLVHPAGIAVSPNGEVFFSDVCLSRIFKITNNKVTIVAGGAGKSAMGIDMVKGCGIGGDADGLGRQSSMTGPKAITFDKAGNLYIIDGSTANNYIRRLTPDGFLTTYCRYYYNEQTGQYEKSPSPVAVNNQPKKTTMLNPAVAIMQEQLDTYWNDSNTKQFIKDVQTQNTDSVLNAMAFAGTVSYTMKDDSAYYTLPGKNINALAQLPKQILSTTQLKDYAIYLYKKLAPAFNTSYKTPLVNTAAYTAGTITNSSVLATEAGYIDQAVLLSLKAIEKEPGNPVMLSNAGAIFKDAGLQIAAIVVLEAANKIEPGNSTVVNNLGQAYLALGEKDKATQYLVQAIKITPYHPLANTSLAVINYTKGNKQAALECVENSLRGAFTDRAWHLLFKLKPDAMLMDYFRHRYKQPAYFNEDKYKLPAQCEHVFDIAEKKAAYEGYREMLKKVKKEFDILADKEFKTGTDSLMQQVKDKRLAILKLPFFELANAMIAAKGRATESGWEKVKRSQKEYTSQIKLLQQEYEKKLEKITACGAKIALADAYMEKMSVATQEYQKAYWPFYKDFYTDMTFWNFFGAFNEQYRKGYFYSHASRMLSTLLQLAETHFLDPGTDCASNKKLKKPAEDFKVDFTCPVGEDGVEIPFGIAKFSFSCNKWEFEISEGVVINVGHKYSTGETNLAFGVGASLPLFGADKDAKISVPQLHIGPIEPGLSAGIKGQVFFTLRNGSIMDWGGLFEAELDLLGSTRELKTGYVIGRNTGLQLSEGLLKDIIDKELGPQKEAPQINKNVKIYAPQ